MSDVYSLNPQILPGAPLRKEEHRRVITLLVIAVIAIIIIAIAYWLFAPAPSPQVTTPVNNEAQLRSQVAAILRSSTYRPSQAEIDSVATALAHSPSSADENAREAMAAQLKQDDANN